MKDDAERAVRAGLAVIEAVGRLAAPERLNVRLGIASGLVVVGDLIGTGAAQERGVVGETPNLAARLQALAQPGALFIAEGTRRQIGALFEIEDLGLQPLAGFVEPQRAKSRAVEQRWLADERRQPPIPTSREVAGTFRILRASYPMLVRRARESPHLPQPT